jgi:hypothetical protein
MRGRDSRVFAVAVVVGLLGWVLAVPASAAPPTCFGKTATIWGDGYLTGTEGKDVIVGGPTIDNIDALGGNDLICAAGGDDRVIGGLGNDKIKGGGGADLLFGDQYSPVSDDLTGAGDDVIKAGLGVTDSGGGAERIWGDNYSESGEAEGGGDDILDGGSDGAEIVGDSRGAYATGGGNDVITNASYAIGDSDGIFGVAGSGDDRISPSDTSFIAIGDSRIGYDGDSVQGSGGDDLIIGSRASDILVGDHGLFDLTEVHGAGTDVIKAGDGRDFIHGDSAVLDGLVPTGDGADDRLFGGSGFGDGVSGGPGEDELNGGDGFEDDCLGGDGTDTFAKCETQDGPP